MLCAVQITWHSGLKQRAATASHTSLGRDTHKDLTAAKGTYCQNSVAAKQGTILQQSMTGLYTRCPL